MANPKKRRMEIGAVPGQNLDPVRFRVAMSRVAAAVHIVTTNGPAGLAGITATSVASITDDPPMMLFCINKTSPSAARMIENGVFCINTLAPSHEAIAEIFAGRTGHYLGDKFAGGESNQARNRRSGAQTRGRGVRLPSCRGKECHDPFCHDWRCRSGGLWSGRRQPQLCTSQIRNRVRLAGTDIYSAFFPA